MAAIHDEIIDLLRVSLERMGKAIPFIPDAKVYWRDEAAFALSRMIDCVDKLESGEMPCCDYAACKDGLLAVKAYADRLPTELTEQEVPIVMHRPPEEAAG